MSELFGYQAGQVIRRREDDQHALVQASLGQSEDQHQQAEIAIETSDVALQSQKKMLQLLQTQPSQAKDSQNQAPPGGGNMEQDQIPDGLDSLAKMALASGLPQAASEFASKASTIRNNASLIREREATERIKDLTMASNMLDNVTDKESWDEANHLYTITTGKPSPFAHIPFSDETVNRIRGSVATQKDKALADAAKARTAASVATTKEREARVPLIKAQEALTRTRETVLRKAGAVGVVPKAEDLRAVTDVITGAYGGALLPEDARVLARPVAERMLDIMKTDNLPRSAAANRAFLEAQARGEFGGIRPRPKMPGTKDKPQEMPTDKTKLKPNMVYMGKGKYEGQPLLWTGTGFIPADSPVLQPAAGGRPGIDDEESFDNEHTTTVDEGQ